MMDVLFETIRWRQAAKETPNDRRAVLVCSQAASDSPVWIGWHEGGCWFCTDAGEYTSGSIIAWADLPFGPTLCGEPRKPPLKAGT